MNEKVFGLLPDLSVQVWQTSGQILNRISTSGDVPIRVLTSVDKMLMIGREDGTLLAYDTKNEDLETPPTVMQVLSFTVYFLPCHQGPRTNIISLVMAHFRRLTLARGHF